MSWPLMVSRIRHVVVLPNDIVPRTVALLRETVRIDLPEEKQVTWTASLVMLRMGNSVSQSDTPDLPKLTGG